jgi:nicotinamidase-related amidase
MRSASPFDDSRPFLRWLDAWRRGLPRKRFAEAVPDASKAAVMSVDVTIGFCCEGPLSSPRVAGIVPAVVRLFETAHAAGVGNFVIFQDAHDADAAEFDAFGPHSVAGTKQARMVPELAALPFADRFRVEGKNSISCAVGTGLDAWLASNASVDRFIVVGDCTDFCVYQLAMHLRLTANASNTERTVIVPAECVDTFDVPVARADESGIMPHDAPLLHALFLYHMAVNGVEVIAGID